MTVEHFKPCNVNTQWIIFDLCTQDCHTGLPHLCMWVLTGTTIYGAVTHLGCFGQCTRLRRAKITLSLPPPTTQTHSHTTPSPLPLSPPSQGISANEVINFFFDKETRLEWEGTLESVDIVEALTEDTIIFHQLHKRVWPSTQRETLFCSHLCTLPNAPRPENMVGHTWMVCNFSIDHDDVPVSRSV